MCDIKKKSSLALVLLIFLVFSQINWVLAETGKPEEKAQKVTTPEQTIGPDFIFKSLRGLLKAFENQFVIPKESQFQIEPKEVKKFTERFKEEVGIDIPKFLKALGKLIIWFFEEIAGVLREFIK